MEKGWMAVGHLRNGDKVFNWRNIPKQVFNMMIILLRCYVKSVQC
jgi:hypothetical protein